ncbi:MAG: hypothetical protein KDC61_11130 [Saprospiraceae bacterium]|nr:hypothetical protein [Saprospiraceae bacterium]MCB0545639.1 hypothetical protein [Saprospiraceae bacterium]MCB0575104.1 hypothetical protein [Saprospiraceae bacterium]MCB9306475.1 hypothetical protein [Lewinellaceae bacterium]MCB9355459.1 hypothetical protein [Lewinellaceae bacterium]
MKYPFCYLLSGIVLLFLSGSCNKADDQAPGFDMFYQREFFIPPGIGIFDVHHFQMENIPTTYNQLLDQHGKKTEDITGVITAKGSIGGTFGDADLDFIDKVSVRVYDESDPSDWIEIAYRDPMPLDPGNNFALIPSLADAKRFMSKSRFSIDVVLWLRNTTQEESQVRLDLQMKATY